MTGFVAGQALGFPGGFPGGHLIPHPGGFFLGGHPGGHPDGRATALGLALLGLALLGVVLALGSGLRARGRETRARKEGGGGWARARDLRPLRVRRPVPGRLTLGTLESGPLIAAEPRASLIVFGPTQTGKTSGLAVPAILEWPGPVVATSVKADLVRDTLSWRSGIGRVAVYDPTRVTGLEPTGWDPLEGCDDWRHAQRMAAWLCRTARTPGGLTDADFWYAAAAKLLAPLLLAASTSGRTMADVLRWVDTQEIAEVQAALVVAGATDALAAAEAGWRRDERQRSSVSTTAEQVLAAYSDPLVAASAGRDPPGFSPGELLDGGAHTLYVCAPAHEQARLRPVFVTLVELVVALAHERAGAATRPLDPPLLVVLDEAANIAPLPDLDGLASTAAGHGIQLVTIWQDLAQVTVRYGRRAGTVVNNHRAKLLLSGVSDPGTLDHLSRLIGEERMSRPSSRPLGGDRRGWLGPGRPPGREWPGSNRPLASPGTLRGIRPGSAVLLSGHFAPARLRLRPWFSDRRLRTRSTARSVPWVGA